MYINTTHPIFSNFIPENIDILRENYSDDTYEIDTNIGYIRYIKNIYEYEEIVKRVKEEFKEPIFSENAYDINPFPEKIPFNLLTFYGSILYRIEVDDEIFKVFKAKDVTLLDLQCLGYVLMQLCMLRRKQFEAASGNKDSNFGPFHFISAILESCMNHVQNKEFPFFGPDRQRFWTVRNDILDCLSDLINKFKSESKPVIDAIIEEFKKFVTENNMQLRENSTVNDIGIDDWIAFQLYMMKHDCKPCNCEHCNH